LIFVLTINLIISLPIYARAVEQKKLNFPVQTQELLDGEVHYSAIIISPRKLVVKHPELFDLDALSLIQESNVMMLVTKTVSIVNKPVGFFDQKQLMDVKYLGHIMGEQKIKTLGPSSFQVTVPGTPAYSYKMQSFFDADDVSTLPNSKVTQAVNAAKKLDVISQGASTIMFTEKNQFTKFTEGGITVSSFIPMKETKTLIISYDLWAIKKPFDSKNLIKNYIQEISAVKSLIESYP
jgi:hypothetical protein